MPEKDGVNVSRHRHPDRKVRAACADCEKLFDAVTRPVWLRGEEIVCEDCAGGGVESVGLLTAFRSHAESSEAWVHELDDRNRMVIP